MIDACVVPGLLQQVFCRDSPQTASSDCAKPITSATVGAGALQQNSARRACQLMLSTWSVSMTPSTSRPLGRGPRRGSPFSLVRNRAEENQADFLVVETGRDDQCRPAACLLVTCLRIRIQQDDISAVGDMWNCRQIASLPTGRPVWISGWRFRLVVFLRRSSSLYCGGR